MQKFDSPLPGILQAATFYSIYCSPTVFTISALNTFCYKITATARLTSNDLCFIGMRGHAVPPREYPRNILENIRTSVETVLRSIAFYRFNCKYGEASASRSSTKRNRRNNNDETSVCARPLETAAIQETSKRPENPKPFGVSIPSVKKKKKKKK